MPTPCVLYRNGNAAGPRINHVRCGHDIVCYMNKSVQWVQAGTGGISVYAARDPRKYWWSLPAGSEIPYGLVLVPDPAIPGHYFWEPATDMSMARYQQLLLKIGPWARVSLVEDYIDVQNIAAYGGRGSHMELSPKTKRFLSIAVANQIRLYETQLEDSKLAEDGHSDLVNDMMAYKLILEALNEPEKASPEVEQ